MLTIPITVAKIDPGLAKTVSVNSLILEADMSVQRSSHASFTVSMLAWVFIFKILNLQKGHGKKKKIPLRGQIIINYYTN